ncbi:hypothetical protein B0J18DRAFT_413610 [Chaetomium sp. MPI-SDFR-AT-0129]|nr:hypothetical protein B0J18DRAFT_413610 [Chaetomium sp. MPI-SDFR-AT-0129]
MHPIPVTPRKSALLHCEVCWFIPDSLDPDKRYVLLYAPLQFEYRYYVSSRDGDGDISGRLDFLLWSVGQDVELECDGWSGKLNRNVSAQYDPDYWFDCRESIEVGQRSADPNRNKSRWTRVNYEAFRNVLSVNMSWVCDDESPGNPRDSRG